MSPGSLKKPILKLNRLIGHSTAKNHIKKPTIGKIEALDDEKEKRGLIHVYEKQAKEREREEQKRSLQLRRKEAEEELLKSDTPEAHDKYGTWTNPELPSSYLLEHLTTDQVGEKISFTARIHHVRPMSAKLAFVLLRQQVETIQGVLHWSEDGVSEQFVRWAEHLNTESRVHVVGSVRRAPEPVKGCTMHEIEIMIERMHLLSRVEEPLAIDVYGMDRVEENQETRQLELVSSNRVRVGNRIIFLRTPTVQSIFRINSGICSIWRTTLEEKGFIEIHTPKLQPAATESGAEVFQVKYFGRTAFLAQSPQLAKQMTISADFGRVFEIGPVFRAEDSNTHRHLTEYTGLDIEMAIERDYHEAMDVIDDLLKSIFKGIYKKYRKELDLIKTRFPHDDLVWIEETPRLAFKQGIELLNSSGWTDDSGEPASEFEDLSTRAEIRLGQLVKEKYKTDYYILDKFPKSARPFYTHLDKDDDQFTNSFDIFVRGQEITTGGQRINDPHILKERMKEAGVDPSTMEEYMQAFEWGAPPHAGCGVGLERVLFLLLNLGDIRNASLYPRDPKSLPEKAIGGSAKLPHPEADTITYAFERERGTDIELPTVEKLIANYGDATNTSWLDDRYHVWRHDITGAAVGYAEEAGYALVMGNPLCDPRQFPIVIRAFLKHLRKEKDLRPLWLLVSPEVENILGDKLDWRTLTCVAEERVEVDSANRVVKKERQAQNAGVKFHELPTGTTVSEEFRKRCVKRIEDWKGNRKGTQVHITEVRPWIDMEHRRYVWAEDKDGEIAGLVILHQLAPQNGYQIKFALDFPGSPTGSIEALISKSIQSLAGSGIKKVTFGAGAMSHLDIGHNLNGMRAKILSHTYKAVAQQLKLVQKSEFREKFGTQDDPVYICYPFMGLGVSGARTLIKFFEDEM